MPPFQSRSTGAPQDRADQLGRRERVVGRRCRARARTCARDRDRLRRAREDAAALARSARVVVGPRRARQLEQPLALGERRRAASGSGSRKMCRWSNAATQPDVRARAACRCRTRRRDMSPMPTTVKSSVWMSMPSSRKWRLHRLPRAARGDAHRLVVVARRAAGGERVAEPEAVLDRDLVGDVGEGRGALVGGDDEVGVVAVVAHARRGGGTTAPSTRLSVTSSRPQMKVR